MLLLIISYLVVGNKCQSKAPKGDNFVVFVVVVVVVVVVVAVFVVVVALLVIADHTIFSYNQLMLF